MDVPYLSGCFMLFRVEALRKVGLFDERFFMSPEDIDISRRMDAEFRTVFFPGATIVHDHARESYKSMRSMWIHAENLIRYFNKWGWIHKGCELTVTSFGSSKVRGNTPTYPGTTTGSYNVTTTTSGTVTASIALRLMALSKEPTTPGIGGGRGCWT
jgi:cellulose synthase/poly-beta-1,6-N-acetylglucosamine synthase-like glycosyltransferase